MRVAVPTRRLQLVWVLGAVSVIALGVIAELMRFVFLPGRYVDTLRIASLHQEATLPTWFSAMTFFSIAILAALLAQTDTRARAADARAWWIVGAFFFWLSLDETAMLHEHAGKVLQITLAGLPDMAWGPFHYRWTIFGVVVLALVPALLGRWFRAHPAPFQRRLILGFGLMVLGGLGFEMIEGVAHDADLSDGRYAILTTIEESLEILGAGILLFAFSDHLAAVAGHLRVDFGEAGPA